MGGLQVAAAAAGADKDVCDCEGSVTKRVIVLLCNKSLLEGFVKVTNLPYLEGFCYVTKPSTWRVFVT